MRVPNSAVVWPLPSYAVPACRPERPAQQLIQLTVKFIGEAGCRGGNYFLARAGDLFGNIRGHSLAPWRQPETCAVTDVKASAKGSLTADAGWSRPSLVVRDHGN
jgi:hypothetical protein